MNFNEKLENILKENKSFCDSNGKLLKQKVKSLALSFDEELIETLLNDADTKEHFFKKIGEATIFDYRKLIDFIDDKNFLLDSYTKFSNKVGLTISNKHIKQIDDVVLTFPFKDCILEGGQSKEDENRKEIFFNETLAKDEISRLLDKKVISNATKYYYENNEVQETTDFTFTRDKEINAERGLGEDTITDNLIIKGNNLLALHSLKSNFAGKVKLIYIDPPYNTGKDSFGYNDNFNHSTWLTFMKNRLEIARELLSENGVILVQADDKEQAYLKVLMDDIFKMEQFETSFYVQVRYGNKTLSEDNNYQKVMEVIHVYSKRATVFRPNKLKEEYSLNKFKYKITELKSGEKVVINGKTVEIFKNGQYKIEEIKSNINGLKETWATGSLIRQGGTAAEFLSKYLIDRKKQDGLSVLYKVYGMGEDGLGYRYITGPKKEEAFRGKFFTGVPTKIRKGVESGDYLKEKPIPNFLYNFLEYQGDFGNCRLEGNVDIGGGKKPEELLKHMIEYFTNPNDIVLDFFGGSGTTSATSHKLNRQYITIEQLDKHIIQLVQRLNNVINKDITGISKSINWQGGGEFIYFELDKYNQKFIDDLSVATEENILDIYKEITKKGFLNYDVELKKVEEHFEEFKAFSLEEKKEFLISMLNKNMLYKNLTEINDETFKIDDRTKALNKDFYNMGKV